MTSVLRILLLSWLLRRVASFFNRLHSWQQREAWWRDDPVLARELGIERGWGNHAQSPADESQP
jgi:hypothetical protein